MLLAPPLTVEGDSVKLARLGGLMINDAVLDIAPRLAVIVAVFEL
jgi:hypothetical protein